MKSKTLILLLLIAIFYSCSTNNAITIEPIDKEFNMRLMDIRNLDSRLYSTKDLLQYYEVSDFEGMTAEVTQQNIDDFINANYKIEDIVINELTFLFYKHDLFSDYRKYVYEAARDTDTGLIPDYNKNLLSRVRFSRVPLNKAYILRTRILYKENEILLELNDTLIMKK